eukprot:s5357_g3.t1
MLVCAGGLLPRDSSANMDLTAGWLTTTISRASGEDGGYRPLLILTAVIRTSSKEVAFSKPNRGAKWHIPGCRPTEPVAGVNSWSNR